MTKAGDEDNDDDSVKKLKKGTRGETIGADQ